MIDMAKAVFTTGDVAKICGVAPRTVSKWFDQGKLGGYRVPGSQDRRIPRAALLRLLREHGFPVPAGLAPAFEVQPLEGVGYAVVHSATGGVRCECGTADEAARLAGELNEAGGRHG